MHFQLIFFRLPQTKLSTIQCHRENFGQFQWSVLPLFINAVTWFCLTVWLELTDLSVLCAISIRQSIVFVDLLSEVDTASVIPQLIQKNLRIAFLSIAVQIENHCLEGGAGNFLSKNALQMFICFPWEMGEGIKKNHKQTKMETNCGKRDKRTIEVASLSQTKASLLFLSQNAGKWTMAEY